MIDEGVLLFFSRLPFSSFLKWVFDDEEKKRGKSRIFFSKM